MSDKEKSGSSQRRRIPPPNGLREPLKVNLFELMQGGNTQLMPLFPYFGADAIVPAGAIMRGGPSVSYGQFFHWNTVDEVAISFGGQGSFVETGQVHVGANMHGVNSFLINSEDPDSFLVTSITQRQRIGEKQEEAVIFRCAKCKEILLRFDFDATPPPIEKEIKNRQQGPAPFPSLIGSCEAATRFNAEEKNRTCAKCGTINPLFPLERWGWTAYVAQSGTVNDGERALREANETAAPKH